ncbi:hypothetical protein EJ08DRAFT_676261 [Tothia fuscella]|uniref:BTB domain-containing protein n=1 Tax=Tothia fuscella TaxID=1048955 RepID=A0A9P4NZ92_9PEZI|nr:hypothetical protein EJ08DRAFT_676261 [Tothia fuscella]
MPAIKRERQNVSIKLERVDSSPYSRPSRPHARRPGDTPSKREPGIVHIKRVSGNVVIRQERGAVIKIRRRRYQQEHFIKREQLALIKRGRSEVVDERAFPDQSGPPPSFENGTLHNEFTTIIIGEAHFLIYTDLLTYHSNSFRGFIRADDRSPVLELDEDLPITAQDFALFVDWLMCRQIRSAPDEAEVQLVVEWEIYVFRLYAVALEFDVLALQNALFDKYEKTFGFDMAPHHDMVIEACKRLPTTSQICRFMVDMYVDRWNGVRGADDLPTQFVAAVAIGLAQRIHAGQAYVPCFCRTGTLRHDFTSVKIGVGEKEQSSQVYTDFLIYHSTFFRELINSQERKKTVVEFRDNINFEPDHFPPFIDWLLTQKLRQRPDGHEAEDAEPYEGELYLVRLYAIASRCNIPLLRKAVMNHWIDSMLAGGFPWYQTIIDAFGRLDPSSPMCQFLRDGFIENYNGSADESAEVLNNKLPYAFLVPLVKALDEDEEKICKHERRDRLRREQEENDIRNRLAKERMMQERQRTEESAEEEEEDGKEIIQQAYQ